MSVYHPFEQEIGGGRLLVHTQGDPYSPMTPITRIIREMSADQPVERTATLADVLVPNRLNALVFGGFARVALMIAIVGRGRRAGVLGERADARVWVTGVLREGAVIAVAGILAGALGWRGSDPMASRRRCRARAARDGHIQQVTLPGTVPTIGRRRGSAGGGDPGIAHAGRARLTRGCESGAAE